MKYFNRENYEKCMGFVDSKIDDYGFISVSAQQELFNFMHENKIFFQYCLENKTLLKTLAKMKLTANNPEKTPNWANTLSNGSQVIWNRKSQCFFHVIENHCEQCMYLNYRDLFPEVDFHDPNVTWLIDNMYRWRFNENQVVLVSIFNGKYNEHVFMHD